MPYTDSDIRVKPMMRLLMINTHTSKHEKDLISSTVQEVFEEADMWLVQN
ncbi:virulence protein [Citrobacter europaeus]|nr:virulence protein [Citrobacter europaeus]